MANLRYLSPLLAGMYMCTFDYIFGYKCSPFAIINNSLDNYSIKSFSNYPFTTPSPLIDHPFTTHEQLANHPLSTPSRFINMSLKM